MHRSMLYVLAAAAALIGVIGIAFAQPAEPYGGPTASIEAEAVPRSASPYGATYIPGVGFRYVAPGAPRVYGYYAGPRVYGYRTSRREGCDRFWFWHDCRWRR